MVAHLFLYGSSASILLALVYLSVWIGSPGLVFWSLLLQ